jgi:hypothetical protein
MFDICEVNITKKTYLVFIFNTFSEYMLEKTIITTLKCIIRNILVRLRSFQIFAIVLYTCYRSLSNRKEIHIKILNITFFVYLRTQEHN